MRSLGERSAITHLVLTRGAKPALALSAGRLASVHGPRLEVQDPRGGGDSVTAGLTAQLCRGVEFWDALRLGVAAATLNVARHGLGTGRADAIAALVGEEIGRAHVCTPVTNAQIVCRFLLEQKKIYII